MKKKRKDNNPFFKAISKAVAHVQHFFASSQPKPRLKKIIKGEENDGYIVVLDSEGGSYGGRTLEDIEASWLSDFEKNKTSLLEFIKRKQAED